MQKTKPENLDRPRHSDIQRDSMDDIREFQAASKSGEVRYRDPNRDRTRGEADRTGRHFDEEFEERDTAPDAGEEQKN
jgi:hypothetical protein